MSTGQRIRKRRKELGLTQRKMMRKLERLGLRNLTAIPDSQSTISNIESDKRPVNELELRMFALVLDTTPEQLRGDTPLQTALREIAAQLDRLAGELIRLAEFGPRT